MRLLKFVVRKSLLALGYPRLETSHPELGVYEVGAIRARMAPDIPACQFFYPVDSNSELSNHSKTLTGRKIPYYRKEAVDGLLDFLGGFGDGIMQMLQEKSHPLKRNYGMDPAMDPELLNAPQFPLVVFSHGLSGTMEMYTQLCSQIASTGCVVVAVEHEDGSASYAQSLSKIHGNSTDIPYKRPDAKIPYTRQNVVDFRFPMLQQRVQEIQNIIGHFEREETEKTEDSEQELLQKIVSIADQSRLHLVGHSFGGATQLLAAQTWENKRHEQQQNQLSSADLVKSDSNFESGVAMDTVTTVATKSAPSTTIQAQESLCTDPLAPTPLSITVFDAWNFALPDRVLKTGLGAKTSETSAPPMEVLSVLSESWAKTSPEREQTLEFLRNCNAKATRVRSCYAKNSVHQSVSDTEAFVPTVAAQRIQNRGKGEPRHQTIRAVAQEVARFVHTPEDSKETKPNIHQTEEEEEDRVLVRFPL